MSLARTLDVNHAAVALSRRRAARSCSSARPTLSARLPGACRLLGGDAGRRAHASYEEINLTLAGRALHVMETCIVAPGHEDTFDRVYVADVDVSERRRADDLLPRYRLLFAEARDIMLFVRATDGRIVEANAAAEAAYGYTREELLRARHLAPCAPMGREPAARGADRARRRPAASSSRPSIAARTARCSPSR